MLTAQLTESLFPEDIGFIKKINQHPLRKSIIKIELKPNILKEKPKFDFECLNKFL